MGDASLIYTMKIPQLAALRASFAQAPWLVAAHTTIAINTSLVALQRDAKKNAPIDNGTLRSSIQIIPAQRVNNTLAGSVGTRTKYAEWVERGTGIYGPYKTPIVPKTKPFLVFKTNDGRWIRTRSVKGMRPTWFMKNSLIDNRLFIQNQFQHAVDAVAKAIAKGGA